MAQAEGKPRRHDTSCAPFFFRRISDLLQWDDQTPTIPRERISQVPYRNRGERSRGRLLLCHDCAHNYSAADCHGVHGADGGDTAYRFREWSFVDDFVYFSHHRVSLPPTGWIEAAHRHGSRCLGTVLFEHEAGEKDLAVVLNLRVLFYVVFKLARLAQLYGFDGWLLNVEAPLPPDAPASPANHARSPRNGVRDRPPITTLTSAHLLSVFIAALREQLHRCVGRHAAVIWYDAVTVDGRVMHQSQLNEKNSAFFAVASALYTDYGWSRAVDVEASVQQALALNRLRWEIYLGVDVYGRGRMPGGGRWRTYEAVDMALQYGTSVALFAPAWTTTAVAAAALQLPESVLSAEEAALAFWHYQRVLPQEREPSPSSPLSTQVAAWKRAPRLWPDRVLLTDADLPVDTAFQPGWQSGRYYDMRRCQLQPNYLREWLASVNDAAAAERLEMRWTEPSAQPGYFQVSCPRQLGSRPTDAYAVLRFMRVRLRPPLCLSYTLRIPRQYADRREAMALGLVTNRNRLLVLQLARAEGAGSNRSSPVPLWLGDTCEPLTFCAVEVRPPDEVRCEAAGRDEVLETRVYSVTREERPLVITDFVIIVGDIGMSGSGWAQRRHRLGLSYARADESLKFGLQRLTLCRR
ncbi:hypothetical protein CDCA_CDCA06G1770 [Cyanidium caldarium]|uniref:Cytosolic endo-beta-N-acetylglucosaminidase TIM barrel domain-containing protein n=1 Tax=Cyanidium caldarium TaxID=2771 RepID=A0AAV9ITX6_CYACA|nr:hypothetical protein CDCA_CDCA06G1770 [Cyanidium caldarium]